MLGAASCANTAVEPAPTIQTECLWVEIIRPTQGDVDRISQQLVDQILRHNRLVETLCESGESPTGEGSGEAVG